MTLWMMMTLLPDQTEKPHYIKCGPVPVLRDWRSLPTKELTRAERNMRFVEKYLKAPGGSYSGKPIRLAPFQENFFYSVFDNPVHTRTAILSKARKNAKTATIAMIVICFLLGPEAVKDAIITSGARSQKQAGMIFRMARNMLESSPELRSLVRIVPSSKEIRYPLLKTYYTALSAEGKTAHGDGPLVAILDEAGQVRGDYDAFFEAIITSQGAWEKPLLIIISTQAATDADWLSKQIDDAIDSQDPRIVCHLYTAPEDCEMDDESAWRMANPAYDYFFPKQELIDSSIKAMRMPSFENTFRNLHLNQRIEADSPFVSKATWQQNGAEPDKKGRKKVFGGLDLSAVADLTALVFVTEDGDVLCQFWLPAEGISEKSRTDRVPYDVWVKQGFIETTPGKSIEYEYIAYELKRVFDEYDVQQINFDRFAMKFLLPWLKKAGLSDKQIEKFKEMGQGFVSMGIAVRELESKLLQGALKHGNHPVLAMCAGNAKVEMDATGNRKFTKKKSTGRIDGLVALAMAVEALARYEESKPSEPTLFFV